MIRPRIIVSVEGGIVGDVLTNVCEAEVVVVDWDAGPENAAAPDAVRILRDGKLHVALVGTLPVEQLPSGDFSMVREAIETAGYHPVADSLTCVSRRELATVLAALQLWQSELDRYGLDLTENSRYFGQHEPLTAPEITELLKRLSGVPVH